MTNHSLPLLSWTHRGLFCTVGNFYIDPNKAVENAIITHAHSDHARRGSRLYYCSQATVSLLKIRLGVNISVKGYPFGAEFTLNGVRISFHPAGHILGSAQIRLEANGEVWVVSGDYKREADPSCEPFKVVQCDTFVTEATFGTPRFSWEKNIPHGKVIFDWWLENRKKGNISILFCYSLGKTQRVLSELAPFADHPIFIHQSAAEITQAYRDEGGILAPCISLKDQLEKDQLNGKLIIAPSSILKEQWVHRLENIAYATASGWMKDSLSGAHGSNKFGFVMSDHADWNDINQTIDETNASTVYVLHRSNGALVRSLRKRGVNAFPIEKLVPENRRLPVQQNLF